MSHKVRESGFRDCYCSRRTQPSGVGHVGDKEIKIQIFGSRKRTVERVSQQAIVLRDEVQRPCRIELIIPFGMDDVVVKRGVLRRTVQQAIEDVGVINFQVARWLEDFAYPGPQI